MANSDNRPSELTAEQVSLIHASLEPAAITRAFHLVCSELLGSCDLRVFHFAADDPTRVVRFDGDEEQKSLQAPSVEEGGYVVGISETAIEDDASGAGGIWRVVVPLHVDHEALGLVQAGFERSLEPSEIARLQGMVGAFALAVRNARTFEKTKRLTFTDDLTALYNSRFMALYLDRELKRCRRTRTPLSLLFMDLDGFKNINDTHGHLAGSRTLVEVGLVLEKTVRDADVLIRYGGDEFVILFPETPLGGGLVIAERIRHVIGATKFLESQNIEARVSASIGIAAYPESADDVRSLISSADRAMYQAKALGKNRVVAASPVSPTP